MPLPRGLPAAGPLGRGMVEFGIRVEGTATELWDEPLWVVSHYPELIRTPGENWLELSPFPEHAKRFRSALDASMELMRSYGVRADGLPDRPLRAFTVTILAVP